MSAGSQSSKCDPRRALLSRVALGLWLAIAMVVSASAQPTLPHGSSDYPCRPPPGGGEPHAPQGYPVIATVKEIDRQRGILELDTKEGRYALAAPAESQQLQAGDQVLVCLEGDNIDGEDRLAAAGL